MIDRLNMHAEKCLRIVKSWEKFTELASAVWKTGKGAASNEINAFDQPLPDHRRAKTTCISIGCRRRRATFSVEPISTYIQFSQL
jgi:hypothetical protein